jgi:hypothetical protein
MVTDGGRELRGKMDEIRRRGIEEGILFDCPFNFYASRIGDLCGGYESGAGVSLKTLKDLNKIKILRLLEVNKLKNSYLHLVYQVI